ncbi:AtzE family amidohydrolase [Flavisphingomonas formosensis]|uniref:AtzE family amidohydrolase n=1 Tax=Flavisphingomonas formosensis TaxID=861534 RepID=UPI0012FCE3EA|nr:AtzE family amidohydrolase [Sphingomonas formosensis]
MKLCTIHSGLAGIVAIAQAVRDGHVSATALIESRLTRIERLNPRLNCFTEILFDRARREAERIDTLVAEGIDPGPLAGVPFGVKDNYDVAGRVTTAGSIINAALPPAGADAVLLQRLTAAGAVLVGTQNMDEYAYGFTTENAHYGATRNPADTGRSAGGSSGGSAAAVAAGLCEGALGTDTNGSIRVPASFCGIFGLKPTFGRLPRTGTFPFVHELDHLGPFARNATDLALIYDILQGHDVGDAACADRRREPVSHLLDTPFTARVALLGGWFEEKADAQGRAAARAVADALGAVAPVVLPGAEAARAAAFTLTAASGGNLHRRALQSRAADFDPATRDRLLAGALLPANIILQAQRVRSLFREQLHEVFRHHDLLIAPATPCAAPLLGQPTIEVNGQALPTRPNIGLLTQPLSFVGVPIAAVPVQGDALPIGVQIVAPPWREDLALRAAALLERRGIATTRMRDSC